jgi:hypothetical protein
VATSEATQIQSLRARWEAVEVQKARELAALTDDRARRIIASLEAAAAWRTRSDWSGLVDRQALFLRARAR